MEDWMTPEEKSIIIPHIMGAANTLHDLKTTIFENVSDISSFKEKLAQVKKPKFTFETGSTYEGEWDAFGMSGKGVFKMFNGVFYVGEMDDGMLHGKGTMWYPNCSRLEGVWKKGILQDERRMVFNDNLPYKPDNWGYCTENDRRFLQEIRYGINPTGRTLLSATVPPKQIPPGCYDTGDGFYNPLTKCVYNAQGDIIRIPKRSEEKHIMENYRKSNGQPTYDLPGVHPFPQEWSDTISKHASGWQNADKQETMERDLLSMENEDDKREEKTHDDKCVGRYNLLETEGEERDFQIIDEGESSENLAVDLPVLKEHDRRLIIDPEVEVTDSHECSEEKAHVIGNKLALLMNVFRKVDQVGGPHKLTEEDCKKFRKQLALHSSEIDVDLSTELEMAVDDIEPGNVRCSSIDDDDIDLVNPDGILLVPKKYKNTYKLVDGIVEEICDRVLQDTNETDTGTDTATVSTEKREIRE